MQAYYADAFQFRRDGLVQPAKCCTPVAFQPLLRGFPTEHTIQAALTAGAGCGSSLLEASVRGPDGQPSVYAMADIRTLVSALWPQMEAIQAELAAAAEQEA